MKLKNKTLSLLLAALLTLAGLPAMAEDAAVTRACAVDRFIRAAGLTSDADGPLPEAFGDWDEVPEEYRNSMAVAVSDGIIKGTDGNLNPNAELTRLEAMIILGRCLPEVPVKREPAGFSDVPDWAEEEIERLYRGGLVNGYGSGILGSYDLISEEQLDLLTGRVRSALSGDVSLKDDFYAAVNREWLAAAVIPEGKSEASINFGRLNEIDGYLLKRSRELLEKYKAGEELKPVENRAARFFDIALKYLEEDADAVGPLKKYFDRIDGCVNVLEIGSVNGTILRDLAVPVLFDISIPCVIGADGYAESLSGAYIDWLGSGIDRSYWADDPDGTERAFADYASGLLALAGIENSGALGSDIAAFERETALAGMGAAEYALLVGDENVDEDYHIFDWKGLGGLYSGRWLNPIPSVFFSIDSRELTNFYAYIITDRGAVDKAVELMNTADLSTVKALCKFNLIEQLSNFLPGKFMALREKLDKEVMGVEDVYDTEEWAAVLTSDVFTGAYEADFVRNNVKYDAGYIRSMTDDIVETFEKLFGESGLMSSGTVDAAVEKLRKMTKAVAVYEGDGAADGDLQTVEDGKSLMSNVVRMMEANGGSYMSVVDFVDIDWPGYTVNATYSPYLNKINVYAGLLYPPVYDPEASYEDNLGGIGFIIAHEISHAFDKMGSEYDADGYYAPWMSGEDADAYDRFVEKLDKYFSRYTDYRGNPVNVTMTGDENIADILAMECIVTLAKEKNLDLDRIFRSYARCWASVKTPEYTDYISRVDTHSPNTVRVNAVLSDFDEFYELYGVAEGDGMYVPPEERVHLFY